MKINELYSLQEMAGALLPVCKGEYSVGALEVKTPTGKIVHRSDEEG